MVQTRSVRETDAVEISADNPTVYLCDAGSDGEGKMIMLQRLMLSRCIFLQKKDGKSPKDFRLFLHISYIWQVLYMLLVYILGVLLVSI